jgi:chemotaxis response regulator CheB
LKSIRILIEAMPRMLREIIEGAVKRQPDMVLVDCAGDPDLATAVKRCTPNVVIVADANSALTSSPQKLLIDNPELKVFVVTDDGRSGHLLEFRRLPVAHMSPEGLITAIRAAVA